MAFVRCPNCGLTKWATVTDPANFRLELLRCMECGFEVDARVARMSRRILKRDAGQDTRADVPETR